MLEISVDCGERISDAIAKIPFGEEAVIKLSDGYYREKLVIDKPNLTVIGSDNLKCTIGYDDCANKIHSDGRPYNTFRSYSVIIIADNVRLVNLCIENSTKKPAQNGQCVALSVYGNNVRVSNCVLRSTQDTLFCAPLPDDLIVRYDGFLKDYERFTEGELLQLFDNCKIIGSVDFIFGCANAWFYNCELVSVYDGRSCGYVAAPSHSLKQYYGFQFINCNFSGDSSLNACVYLARPWRDFGKCVFINSRLSSHISPRLFDKWGDSERDKTARFAEYGSTGLDNLDCVGWGKKLAARQVEDYLKLCDDYFSNER